MGERRVSWARLHIVHTWQCLASQSLALVANESIMIANARHVSLHPQEAFVSDDLLDWVYAYLEQDEEIVVPIKKMWNEWRATRAGPSLEVFAARVLAEDRIEEMGGIDHAEGKEWIEPDELEEYMREMEELGFFSGPRAKLKSREITLEHVAKMIRKHNDRMDWALQQARESLPESATEQEEGALIEIQYQARQLRRQLREIGLELDEAESED